jgi:hypothetical protein
MKQNNQSLSKWVRNQFEVYQSFTPAIYDLKEFVQRQLEIMDLTVSEITTAENGKSEDLTPLFVTEKGINDVSIPEAARLQLNVESVASAPVIQSLVIEQPTAMYQIPSLPTPLQSNLETNFLDQLNRRCQLLKNHAPFKSHPLCINYQYLNNHL